MSFFRAESVPCVHPGVGHDFLYGNVLFPDGGFQGDVLAVQLNRHILKSDEKQVAFIVAVQCIAFDDEGRGRAAGFVLEVESLGSGVSGGAGLTDSRDPRDNGKIGGVELIGCVDGVDEQQ